MSYEAELDIASLVIMLGAISLTGMVLVLAFSVIVSKSKRGLVIDIDYTNIPAHHALKVSCVSSVFIEAHDNGMDVPTIQHLLEVLDNRQHRVNLLETYTRCTDEQIRNCIDMCSLYKNCITITEFI